MLFAGVPIGPDNYFYLPLWTDWHTGANPGILDWYTVIGGLMRCSRSLCTERYTYRSKPKATSNAAPEPGQNASPFVSLTTVLAIPATVLARPDSLHNYRIYPAAFLSPIAVVISLVAIPLALRRRSGFGAFLASCAYLSAMLCGAAAGLFPVLLPSISSSGESITIASAIAGPHALRVGLAWWIFGIMLALLYFGIVYWLFRAKVTQYADTYGH